ncbi:MAG: GntR family transcriptional regulator [Rhodanobacteraceae bacterium]
MTNQYSNVSDPLYRKIAEDIKAAIRTGVWKYGQRIPSERELMPKYQVSRITARQALQIIEQEGLISRSRGKGSIVTYKPDAQANQPKHTFGFLTYLNLETMSSDYPFVPVMQAFQVAVDKAGGRIEFVQTPDQERKAIRPEVIDRLIQAKVEAVATFRMTGERYMERVMLNGIRLVAIDHRAENPKIGCVSVDHDQIVRTALNYLMRRGHERIAFVAGLREPPPPPPGAAPNTPPKRPTVDRDAYLMSLRLKSIATELGLNPEKVQALSIPAALEESKSALNHILAQADRPTGFFFYDYRLGLRAKVCALEKKLESVQEFDHLLYNPSPKAAKTHTHIAVDYYQMGTIAAELLMRPIGDIAMTGLKVLVPGALIVRRKSRAGQTTKRLDAISIDPKEPPDHIPAE